MIAQKQLEIVISVWWLSSMIDIDVRFIWKISLIVASNQLKFS